MQQKSLFLEKAFFTNNAMKKVKTIKQLRVGELTYDQLQSDFYS